MTHLYVHHGLPVGVVVHEAAAHPGPQVPGHLLRQARVGVPRQDHHPWLVASVHDKRIWKHTKQVNFLWRTVKWLRNLRGKQCLIDSSELVLNYWSAV